MTPGEIKFKNEAENIHLYFPELQFIEPIGDTCYISGELVLNDDNGNFVDSYSVKIVSSKNYPENFPLVYEIGGRIPNNIDWHVYSEGHCCIKATPEEILICRNGITLVEFINTQVKPYFFNQKFRELYGHFLNERSHGPSGHIEFFQEKFKTNNLRLIIKGLIMLYENNIPNRTANCFCGSDLKFRKCHREAILSLMPLTKGELYYFIGVIRKEIR